MRNLKKFLALVLAMLMVVSASAMVSADFTDVADDNRYAVAINDLAVKGITTGTSATTFGPDESVTRKQMAIFIARAVTGDVDNTWEIGLVPFTDVKDYKGAIELCYMAGIINGMSATTFAPEDGITYAQALKMAVCALGYEVEWDNGWGAYRAAAELGLTYNMDVDSIDEALNRAETAQVIYNMLYATPADGGDCLASTVFGLATAENVTLFAVTATPKQYYSKNGEDLYNSADDHEDGVYVGVQKLVNGIPTGTMVFVTCDELGIDEDDVEDYFNYAVELVNFDEDTHEFDDAIIGNPAKVVEFGDITVDNTAHKLTIDSIKYTGVDSITGATLINEMVIYKGNSIVAEAKYLDVVGGYVYNAANANVARFLYTSSTGVSYYKVLTAGADYDVTNNPTGLKTGDIITDSEALAKFGIAIRNPEAAEFTRYDVLTTANKEIGGLKGQAYELKLFDDDNDGLYERAFYTPIYLGMYTESGSGADTVDELASAVDSTASVKKSAVTYTNTAAQTKGKVLVFTYNEQLKVVDVREILTAKTGTIDSVKTTIDGYQKNVTTVIDGTTYKVGDSHNTGIKGAPNGSATLGAILVGKGSFESIAKVENGTSFNYQTSSAFAQAYVRKMEIKFYEYNNILICSSPVTAAGHSHTYALVDDVNDYDIGEIYLDMYVSGTFESAAPVSYIDGQRLADLSSWKLAQLFSKGELFYPGTLYCAEMIDGAYEMVAVIDPANPTHGLIDASKAAAGAAGAGNGEITFFKGYSNSTTDRTNMIRTTASTVFHFITTMDAEGNLLDEAATVDTVMCMPDNAKIVLGAKSKILVDKLGYDGDNKGIASVVYVYDATISGFTTALDQVKVITTDDKTKLLQCSYTKKTAEDWGLDSKYFDSQTLYYRYENVAVNLDTGKKITLYVEELDETSIQGDIEESKIYLVDLISETEAVVCVKSTDSDVAPEAFVEVSDITYTYGANTLTGFIYENELFMNTLVTENGSLNNVWKPIINDKDDINKIVIVKKDLTTKEYTSGDKFYDDFLDDKAAGFIGAITVDGDTITKDDTFLDYTANGILVIFVNA